MDDMELIKYGVMIYSLAVPTFGIGEQTILSSRFFYLCLAWEFLLSDCSKDKLESRAYSSRKVGLRNQWLHS
jgi:hypothetical protein